MPKSPKLKKSLHLRISKVSYDRLADGEGSVQSQIRNAINVFLSKRDRSGYREVVLSPKGNIPIDQMLSWLASGAPLLRDLQGSPGLLNPIILKPMSECLSPIQLERVRRWVEGDRLSDIGRLEGVSKQAVHSSIQRSLRKLAEYRPFLVGLCELFPESGMTPEYLMRAAEENLYVQEKE